MGLARAARDVSIMVRVMGFNELEVCVLRASGGAYDVQMRYECEGSLTPMVQAHAPIDLQALEEAAASDDPSAYGAELFRQLFCTSELRERLDDARRKSAESGAPLRLRLYLVSPAADVLQGLQWERLCDPATRQPLLLEDRLLFTRYLGSGRWMPVHLRPRSALRALVVVASPNDLEQYGLRPIDAAAEVARAKDGLRGIACSEVCGPDSLARMMAHLHEAHDILYIVCHGARSRKTGEPSLWLEGADGASDVKSGAALVDALAHLPQPRLVVLASCSSAGDGGVHGPGVATEGPLAVGPKLAEMGVPAVLAMQGSVSVEAAGAFLSAFFEQLTRDGCVDRAAAVARASLAATRGAAYWAPVLFTRILDGSIWRSVTRVGDAARAFDGWQGLKTSIEDGRCIPVLGPGILEGLVGTPDDLARRWAAKTMASKGPGGGWAEPEVDLSEFGSLPRVAQVLADRNKVRYLHAEYPQVLLEQIRRRCGELPDDPAVDERIARARQRRDSKAVGEEINKRLEAARKRLAGRSDLFSELAQLDLRLFLTTNPDDQLERALQDKARARRASGAEAAEPLSEVCRWHDRPSGKAFPPSVIDSGGEVWSIDSSSRPLVYHLYGRLEYPDSLVLTEDDYFDYLRGPVDARMPWRLPDAVRGAFLDSALMFLGFRMDAWDFRVLYRNLLGQYDDQKLPDTVNHIAVQLDPEVAGAIDPVRARESIQRYFADAHIHFFWGPLDEFIHELIRQCVPAAAAPRAGGPA